MNRTFRVHVPPATQSAIGCKGVVYPPCEGEKALGVMERFAIEGVTTIADTTANGVTEWLSIEDMREIYEAWIPPIHVGTKEATS